jgi:hypothetical protein
MLTRQAEKCLGIFIGALAGFFCRPGSIEIFVDSLVPITAAAEAQDAEQDAGEDERGLHGNALSHSQNEYQEMQRSQLPEVASS